MMLNFMETSFVCVCGGGGYRLWLRNSKHACVSPHDRSGVQIVPQVDLFSALPTCSEHTVSGRNRSSDPADLLGVAGHRHHMLYIYHNPLTFCLQSSTDKPSQKSVQGTQIRRLNPVFIFSGREIGHLAVLNIAYDTQLFEHPIYKLDTYCGA
jgi:hypothetical protein